MMKKAVSAVLVTVIIGPMGQKAGEQLSSPGLLSCLGLRRQKAGRTLTPASAAGVAQLDSVALCGWRNLLGLEYVQ
jgi:hypothetical protein